MKLCKHCKYFKRGFPFIFDSDFSLCSRTQEFNLDIISGKIIRKPLIGCKTERTFSFRCGPNGKYWEPKP